MSDSVGELPNGWTYCTFAELGVWGSGGTPSRKDAQAFGGAIPWLKIGDLPDGPVACSEEFITAHGLRTSSAKLIPANTLLIAMYGASIGKLGLTTTSCATNQAIASCEPYLGIDVHYLFYYALSQRKGFIGLGQGGAQPNISQGILKDYQAKLAPCLEQQRIVSKIDELFSSIDEGERALERVRKLVERYRQSVLKAAVTGELTREWREQHAGELESGEALLTRILEARRQAWEKAELAKMKSNQTSARNNPRRKYKEPMSPNLAGAQALPKGWCWTSLDQTCHEFGNGLADKPNHEPPGIPILRISAVRALAVNSFDLRYYVGEGGAPAESSYVHRGDLLFTRYNGSKELVGVSGVYGGADAVLHPDKLIKGRVASSAITLPSYLAIALNSGPAWKYIVASVKTSAGQHGIAGSDLKRAPIPLPPCLEQASISDLYSDSAVRCQNLDLLCDSELRRCAGLRQAVLKAAFSGHLVSQDPTDEPASVLLERIAAERAAAPKRTAAKATRTKKTKSKIKP